MELLDPCAGWLHGRHDISGTDVDSAPEFAPEPPLAELFPEPMNGGKEAAPAYWGRAERTCEDCPGWHDNADVMWLIVLVSSISSPVMVMLSLRFLKGDRDDE